MKFAQEITPQITAPTDAPIIESEHVKCSSSTSGVTGLAQGLPGSQVQFLDFWSNNIGDEGAKELAQPLPGSSAPTPSG
jgi:hypothetical protein